MAARRPGRKAVVRPGDGEPGAEERREQGRPASFRSCRPRQPALTQGSTPSALTGWPQHPEGDQGARLRAQPLCSAPARDPRKGAARSSGRRAPRSEWREGPRRTRLSGDAGEPQAPPRGRRPDNASGPGGAAAALRPSAGTRRGWDQSAAAATAARAVLLCRAGPGAGPGPGAGWLRPSLYPLPP